MADDGIKKVTVLKKNLPPLGKISGSYVVRYRISTDDKNRTSHWSPAYTLDTDQFSGEQVPASISYSQDALSQNLVKLIWTPDTELELDKFDIYTRVIGVTTPAGATEADAYPWKFIGTISSTTYEAVIPATVLPITTPKTTVRVNSKSFQVAVQIPTHIKAISEEANLYTSPVKTLVV